MQRKFLNARSPLRLLEKGLHGGLGPDRVLVTDHGPGIPRDDVDRIFEPLFSTRTCGVGLGLPLVEQIMLEHGGGAEVLETGADGTTMLLWLPAVSAVS